MGVVTKRGRTLAVAAAFVLLCAFSPLNAQVNPAGSFDELQLFAKPDDPIIVTEANGKTSRARVVQLTDDALSVQMDNATRRLSEADVVEVRQRLSDSRRNGWLIGTAIGVGAGVANVAYNCSHYGSCRTGDIGAFGLDTGLGMLVGFVVDGSIRKTSVVFRGGNERVATTPTNSALPPGQPAQTLADLRSLVRYGQQVEVVELNGNVWKGEIVGLSSKSVRVRVAGTTHDWDETQIREIKKRRKDVWWNGALIGLGAGGLTGTLMGFSACGRLDDECQANAVPAGLLGGMVIGVTAGALIDFSYKKMETAFQVPASSTHRSIGVTPILSRHLRGVSLNVSF